LYFSKYILLEEFYLEFEAEIFVASSRAKHKSFILPGELKSHLTISIKKKKKTLVFIAFASPCQTHCSQLNQQIKKKMVQKHKLFPFGQFNRFSARFALTQI
jgi:hypothetical protein